MGGQEKALQTKTNKQTNTTDNHNSPSGFFQNPRANKQHTWIINSEYHYPTPVLYGE
jgi:hypothetical protein